MIRRREDVASSRSLLNTARLMEDNPLLVRLKALEKITVVGGLNALLDQAVTI